MRISPLEMSDETCSNWLHSRVGATCTMCNRNMREGYCADPQCSTYPQGMGVVFIDRFTSAVVSTTTAFLKKVDPRERSISPVVSGGQMESKRRKH